MLEVKDSTTNKIGEKNPYRYRSYRYDNDTELYYLQKRYYNSEVGRFINADAISGKTGSIISHNAFAYSENNPINKYDPTGYVGDIIWDAFSAAVGLFELVRNPSWGNAGNFALDLGACFIPFVPGGFSAAKTGGKLFRNANKINKNRKNTTRVYHFTNQKGYNAITSNKTYLFKASTPKKNNPKGVYLSLMSPGEILKKPGGFKSYLGLTRDKTGYYFKFDVDTGLLNSIDGGRAQVKYIKNDFKISRDSIIEQGITPRRR